MIYKQILINYMYFEAQKIHWKYKGIKKNYLFFKRTITSSYFFYFCIGTSVELIFFFFNRTRNGTNSLFLGTCQTLGRGGDIENTFILGHPSWKNKTKRSNELKSPPRSPTPNVGPVTHTLWHNGAVDFDRKFVSRRSRRPLLATFPPRFSWSLFPIFGHGTS